MNATGQKMWAAVRPRHDLAQPDVVNPSGDTDTENQAARAAGVEPTCHPHGDRADAETADVD